jgi:hypothetical protein
MKDIINNSQVFKELYDTTGIMWGVQDKPEIIPVVDLTPKSHRIINVVKTKNTVATGAATILTTRTDADFYLVGVSMQGQFDATNDGLYYRVQAYIDALQVDVCYKKKLSTTATDINIVEMFPIPIKIDKGTIINTDTSYTVGNAGVTVLIFGFYDIPSVK